MIEAIKSTIIGPLSTRLGVWVTGVLVGAGANSTHADWVGTGIVGAVLIGCEQLNEQADAIARQLRDAEPVDQDDWERANERHSHRLRRRKPQRGGDEK